jgi:hypothetical protein
MTMGGWLLLQRKARVIQKFGNEANRKAFEMMNSS